MRARFPALASFSIVYALCLSQAPEPTLTPRPPAPPATLPGNGPDMMFLNAVIYTGDGFSNDKPQTVQAMAISGGRVQAVGTSSEIRRLAGPKTRIYDMKSAQASVFIFPGFNDAHVHLGSAGSHFMNIDLTGVKSLAEMLSKVQAFASSSPAGHWLTGGNWDHTLWPDKALPTRQELDQVTLGHPAFLSRIDGHIAVANTAALAAAGITGKTAPPQGGAVDLDGSGEPTGILRESAQQLVEKVIPPPSHDERRRGLELAIADVLAHGVTSVQDFSDWNDFLIYEEIENEGKLNLRITEWLPFKAPLDELISMQAHHDNGDLMLHTGFLKGFLDGSLGSRTAALKEPYADDPGNTGLPQYTQEQLNTIAVERAKAGFQLGFHAIGDRAVEMALEAFAQPINICAKEQVHDMTPPKAAVCMVPLAHNARDRIEHAQVVDPADIPRFARLGVIASMQPCHLLTDMNWAEARLGPQRAAYSYAWKAFLDAGVRLAFGTDYPVEPITPFRGLYAAVTRMNEADTKTYFPENKITRGQALYAYTQGSAYAEFAEQHKGKIAPGFDADFILVDRDLFTAPPAALLQTKVLENYVAGRQVFTSNMRIQAAK